MVKKNGVSSQHWMRARVGMQAFTILAVIAGSNIFSFDKPKTFEDVMERRAAESKLEAAKKDEWVADNK